MTTVAVTPAPVTEVDERRVLWCLARYETLRLLRHPLFVVAALLFVLIAVTTPFSEYANADYDTAAHGTETNLDWPVLPAFFLGLGGLLAMNRITSSSGRAGDVVRSVPVPGPRRTLALCIACLVPAALALLGAAYVFVFWMVDPPVQSENWGEFSNAELVALMAQGVLAALGGSLLGVLTARWWRWPTAAAVTCVLLILWSVSSLAPDKHVLLTLNHVAAPFSLVASNGEDYSWHIGGSLLWKVPYLLGLCGLAAIGACARDAEGQLRRRLVRAAWIVGCLTVACLLVGSLAGPDGYYSWDHR